jgi:hypothetical protein
MPSGTALGVPRFRDDERAMLVLRAAQQSALQASMTETVIEQGCLPLFCYGLRQTNAG